MLILLYGEDSFRLRKKLNEITAGYQAKHKSGLNLVRFAENDLDLHRVKEAVEALSMFNEKKLIILENIFKNKIKGEELLGYLKKNKLKDNHDVVVVVCQEGKLAVSPFKRYFNMLEELKLLQGAQLSAWVKKEIVKRGGKITVGAIKKLTAYVGGNLWQMDSEIGKLVSYTKGGMIDEKEIDLMIESKLDTNIFKTLDALATHDKKTALKLLHEHLEHGENEFYLLTMLVYQMRILLRLKDLLEKGTGYNDLVKKTKLHPYVIKKSQWQLKGFDLGRLKKLYRRLLEIDVALKTGRVDAPTALDLFVAEV